MSFFKGRLLSITRKTEGITLIALVITIIVLLILAGVTIVTLTGENGILTKATESKKENEKTEIIERIKLDVVAKQAENLGTISQEELIEILKKYGTLIDKNTLITTKGNYEILVSDIYNGNIEVSIVTTPLENFEYTLDNENNIVTLTKYIGTESNIYVPATYTINNVVFNTMLFASFSSQSSTFSGNANILTIEFEEGVSTNEMSYMFANCINLRYIKTYPEYNGIWWTGVFYNDTNLISAPQIPNDIENIRITNFYNKCINLLGNYSMPENYDSNYSTNVFGECININKNINVVWFGDSITAGTTTGGESFVSYLREDLEDTGISNYAIGGHTLSYGYDQSDNAISESIITDISKMGIHENVDYVFISAGTNDFAHNSTRRPYGTYRFADIGTINDNTSSTIMGAINNISTIVNKKFPNATLIFTTPITRSDYDIEGALASDGSVYTVHLKDYVDAIKTFCDSKGISYIDSYTESGLIVTEDSCDGTQNYMNDQTHPTLKGQKVLEQYILNKLITDYGFTSNN